MSGIMYCQFCDYIYIYHLLKRNQKQVLNYSVPRTIHGTNGISTYILAL